MCAAAWGLCVCVRVARGIDNGLCTREGAVRTVVERPGAVKGDFKAQRRQKRRGVVEHNHVFEVHISHSD